MHYFSTILLFPFASVLMVIFFLMIYVFPYSERGSCDTVTPVLALHATGHRQTPVPPRLVPDPWKKAAAPVPDQEHGAYAPSRTSCLHCRSFTRSGAAGTLPVPSPSWWIASVLELLQCFYCIFTDVYSMLECGSGGVWSLLMAS